MLVYSNATLGRLQHVYTYILEHVICRTYDIRRNTHSAFLSVAVVALFSFYYFSLTPHIPNL